MCRAYIFACCPLIATLYVRVCMHACARMYVCMYVRMDITRNNINANDENTVLVFIITGSLYIYL